MVICVGCGGIHTEIVMDNMEVEVKRPIFDGVFRLRENPVRRKETVRIGCGAGFGGDRPTAALRLVRRVPNMDYLVLECLAERTLAIRYDSMTTGGNGYDPRISEWMSILLPDTLKNGICIITNMGAVDVYGAQEEVFKVAKKLSLSITVAIAFELFETQSGSEIYSPAFKSAEGGTSTYLGAAPIVHILENSKPNVIITTRVADAALFLAPMVYELGWNWDNFSELSQGILAGHLLECGCQLTGGYYMHPADEHRRFSFQKLLDASLPFADIRYDGNVALCKALNSGGELNTQTCAQQLLYEVADPSAYITPDVIVDFCNVSFVQVSPDAVLANGAFTNSKRMPEMLLQLVPKECGWKGWGEISYGGEQCVERALAADYLVRSWMEEEMSETQDSIISYVIGLNSLWTKVSALSHEQSSLCSPAELRLRMDGLFPTKDHAVKFTKLFEALYTNGPAAGGGISVGVKKEILLERRLVAREEVHWSFKITYAPVLGSSSSASDGTSYHNKEECPVGAFFFLDKIPAQPKANNDDDDDENAAAGGGERQEQEQEKYIELYKVAHGRAGDKGNDVNISIIPYSAHDLRRLRSVITPHWIASLMNAATATATANSGFRLSSQQQQQKQEEVQVQELDVEIYEVRGIMALNVLVRNVLDGGVNCSRRMDRHGKTLSDLILSQIVILPP